MVMPCSCTGISNESMIDKQKHNMCRVYSYHRTPASPARDCERCRGVHRSRRRSVFCRQADVITRLSALECASIIHRETDYLARSARPVFGNKITMCRRAHRCSSLLHLTVWRTLAGITSDSSLPSLFCPIMVRRLAHVV